MSKNASMNAERIQILDRLISGSRKRSVFAVSLLHSHPPSPRGPLLTPQRMHSDLVIATATNDSRPPLLTPTKKSFVNKKRFDFRNYDDGDYTKLDAAWQSFMTVIGLIEIFTDMELNNLRSNELFGNDSEIDMIIGIVMDRDWTAVAHLYLLDVFDSSHLLLLAGNLLTRQEATRIKRQLVHWKEKIVFEHNFRMIWIEGSELFELDEYAEWKKVTEKIKRTKGLMQVFDMITAWCHEKTFHIVHSARLSLRRHELCMYNLWYCPLWLQVLACSESWGFYTQMVLSKYEHLFHKWMDAVINASDHKHLRGFQPKFTISDIIRYIKDNRMSCTLPLIFWNNLCSIMSNMQNQKGFTLAQSIAKVLLSLRYGIIRNETDIKTLKHTFKLCLYCFKREFMNGSWMYVPGNIKSNSGQVRPPGLSLFEPGPLVSSNYSMIGFANYSESSKDLMADKFEADDFVF